MSIQRDLQNAATLLREMGWCQDEYEDENGRFCALGAMAAARNEDLGSTLLYRGPWKALEGHIGTPVGGWNDAPGRTAEEVIAALEAAAEASPDA